MPQEKQDNQEPIKEETNLAPVAPQTQEKPGLDDLPILSEALPEESPIFRIDTIHRLIRNIPTQQIGSSSRAFLKLSPDFLLSGVLRVDPTVTSVAGTAGETTLNSYVVPANMISRNYTGSGTGTGTRDFRFAGNTFRIWAAGRYTTDDATSTVAIALKVGSTTYHTITTTGATVTNAPWFVNWTVIVATIGSSGTAESWAEAQTNNVNKDSASTATQTIDTTASQTISLTATWTGGSAGDNISIRQFILEILN